MTLHQWLTNKFNNNKYKSDYGNLETFAKDHSWNLDDYLTECLMNYKPTYRVLKDNIKSLVKYNCYQVRYIPYQLLSLQKHYNMTIPDKFGIMTHEFWNNKL